MNLKEICKVGFKILVGLAAGVAAVLGINKVLGRKQQSTAPEEETEQNERVEGTVTREQQYSVDGNKLMGNLNQVYNACSKISGIIQTLSMVISNLSSIFGPARETTYLGSAYGIGQGPIVDFGNGAWSRRISPHIVEVNTFGMEPRPRVDYQYQQQNYSNYGPAQGYDPSIMPQPNYGNYQGPQQQPESLFPPDTRRRTSNLRQADNFPKEWKYDENAPCIPEDPNKSCRIP